MVLFFCQGYCQLQTTKGNINVEIHCDIVPRMAENFLGLCGKGYYDGTKFHRSIRNFMLQVRYAALFCDAFAGAFAAFGACVSAAYAYLGGES